MAFGYSRSPRPSAYVAPSEKPWMPKEAALTLYSANTCDRAALMKATSCPNCPLWAGSASHVAPLDSGASNIIPASCELFVKKYLACEYSRVFKHVQTQKLVTSVYASQPWQTNENNHISHTLHDVLGRPLCNVKCLCSMEKCNKYKYATLLGLLAAKFGLWAAKTIPACDCFKAAGVE